MKLCKGNLILLLLTVLTFECIGQTELYKLILKGQPSPFDTAVVVHINQYRKESQKLKAADTLFKSMHRERIILEQANAEADSVIKLQATAINVLTESNQRKDKTIKELNDNFRDLFTEATKPKKWYEKPVVWLGGFAIFEVLQFIF